MKPLMNEEFEKMKWPGFLKDYNLIRTRCETDGSCYFHALAKAYFKPYITGKKDGEPFDRKEFIMHLRRDLAKTLASKVNPQDPKSKTYYATLANGELENISKAMPEYSLESMQKELGSSSPVSNYFNEFISNELNIDIYILDSKTKDVYMTGTNMELLYKDRRSVVILYMPGHYELIGLMNDESYIETYFPPTHPFIIKLRERMQSKMK
jgi:hypothetical protein